MSKEESITAARVQRLGCSVNAAFLPRAAAAHDRNAGFSLLPKTN